LTLLLRTKKDFGTAPGVWVVPEPLTNPPANSAVSSARVVSYFGYEFEAPASSVKEEQRTDNVAVLSFADCGRVVVLKPRPGFTDLVREGKLGARAVEDVDGKEAAHSAYLLRRAALNVTPKD